MNEHEFCRSLVSSGTYRIDDPAAETRASAVGRARAALEERGCAVLPGFLSPSGLARLLEEAEARRLLAYFSPETSANVYFSADDPSLPSEHPRRIFMRRTNGFITADTYGAESASRRLYDWPPLARFIADCLGKPTLHIYADPVSNMIVNVGRPGTEFTWHFDTNEFTITMLLKPAESGGHFEYAPGLRTADDERYEDVRSVLGGCRDRVIRLALEPGDLQIFKGRFSLHRVTENTGGSDRLLLIMSFAERAGMIGSLHRTRSLYGKVTDAHLAAEAARVRNDSLAD